MTGTSPVLSQPLSPARPVVTIDEHAGKTALGAFGLQVPRSQLVPCAQVAAAATAVGFPVVIKASGAGLEHKTELGGVVLNVRNAGASRGGGHAARSTVGHGVGRTDDR